MPTYLSTITSALFPQGKFIQTPFVIYAGGRMAGKSRMLKEMRDALMTRVDIMELEAMTNRHRIAVEARISKHPVVKKLRSEGFEIKRICVQLADKHGLMAVHARRIQLGHRKGYPIDPFSEEWDWVAELDKDGGLKADVVATARYMDPRRPGWQF